MRLSLSVLAFCMSPSALPAVSVDVTPDAIIFRDGDKLITEYRYAGTVAVEKGKGTKPLAKPYFYPLNAPGGTPTTRAWPLKRGSAGETTDHFHQKSAWFCHGDVIPEGITLKAKSSDKHVQGVDFWSEFPNHGRIVCVKIDELMTTNGTASVVTHNEWRTPEGAVVLRETRTIAVSTTGTGNLIAVDIALQAVAKSVTFGDTKEGSFGVRVSDDLRLNNPKSTGVVTSADGSAATGPKKGTLPMWGQVAAWHDYSGTIDGKPVGIAIFADPGNPHPSAWHTRDYGLMAANPFGRDKSGYPAMKGKTELVKLDKGQTMKLRYAIYAHTGDVKTGRVAEAFTAFAK